MLRNLRRDSSDFNVGFNQGCSVAIGAAFAGDGCADAWGLKAEMIDDLHYSTCVYFHQLVDPLVEFVI